jgi:hypothetical protein
MENAKLATSRPIALLQPTPRLVLPPLPKQLGVAVPGVVGRFVYALAAKK